MHLFNVFGTGKDEVLCTYFRVNLQVAEHPVVALVFKRVAAGAVVDEVFGTVLQRDFVVQVGLKGVVRIGCRAAGGEGLAYCQRCNEQDQVFDGVHLVTLVGTGLVLSSLL